MVVVTYLVFFPTADDEEDEEEEDEEEEEEEEDAIIVMAVRRLADGTFVSKDIETIDCQESDDLLQPFLFSCPPWKSLSKQRTKKSNTCQPAFFFFALRLPIKRIGGYGHRSSVKKGGVPSSTDTLFHGDRGEKGRLQMKNHRVLELSIVSIYFDTKS